AGVRIERDDRAALAAERRERRPLATWVERGMEVVARLRPPAELVDERLELVLLPGQLAVVGLLDPSAATRDEGVAHGVREERAGRIAAEVAQRLAASAVAIHGEPRAVVGEDQPSGDLLRLQQGA